MYIMFFVRCQKKNSKLFKDIDPRPQFIHFEYQTITRMYGEKH